jgi:hypothetical protein
MADGTTSLDFNSGKWLTTVRTLNASDASTRRKRHSVKWFATKEGAASDGFDRNKNLSPEKLSAMSMIRRRPFADRNNFPGWIAAVEGRAIDSFNKRRNFDPKSWAQCWNLLSISRWLSAGKTTPLRYEITSLALTSQNMKEKGMKRLCNFASLPFVWICSLLSRFPHVDSFTKGFCQMTIICQFMESVFEVSIIKIKTISFHWQRRHDNVFSCSDQGWKCRSSNRKS